MSLQSTDQIADLITRIRNAIQVGKTEIRVPTSKLKVAVAEGLKKAGYITDYNIEKSAPRDIIHVVINQDGEVAKINEITKISKPGRRIYTSADDIPTVKSGRGIVLISTSKGVMEGKEAKKLRLGGEILIRVW
ncbi:30S ribosomal protein S8 [Candidatus Saccharibacteria bacterium]|nr:30S ribosomal protein S8 [Candidatus Saccharibacteria bacterium]